MAASRNPYVAPGNVTCAQRLRLRLAPIVLVGIACLTAWALACAITDRVLG